jgi:hypothetical protein
VCCISKSSYHDALDAYSCAIQINPYILEVWFDLGSLYESYNNQIVDAIDDHNEDLPEVIVGDLFWLDDALEGRRYEACVTHVDVFDRSRFVVLRMSLMLCVIWEPINTYVTSNYLVYTV